MQRASERAASPIGVGPSVEIQFLCSLLCQLALLPAAADYCFVSAPENARVAVVVAKSSHLGRIDF